MKNNGIDEEPVPETESLLDDPNPMMNGLTIGLGGNPLPTLGVIPSNNNEQPASDVSVGGETYRPGPRSASKLSESFQKLNLQQSPVAAQRNRSVSTPDLEEMQKRLATTKKDDGKVKSFIESTSKNDTSLTNIKSEKSKFAQKVKTLSLIKKLTSKGSLSRSVLDAELDAEGQLLRPKTKTDLAEGPDSARSASMKDGNRLMQLIIKHASSGNLNREAEVFQRIMVLTLSH